MFTRELEYVLPPELIAQTPREPRDQSRMMRVDRVTGELANFRVCDMPELLRPGDSIVLNQTRVIPARLIGQKPSGGRAEVLLLRKLSETSWRAQVGGRNVSEVLFVDSPVRATVSAVGDDDSPDETERLVTFSERIEPWLERIGRVPLPPYIRTELGNADRYQTVYAREAGSAAAPTAGLHFTEELFARLRSHGVGIAFVTLHVGLDTFKPISVDEVEAHHIHSEWVEIGESAVTEIQRVKKAGGRIIAIGTTSVRVLETAAAHAVGGNFVSAYSGDTRLFITPGFRFKVVDGLLTNFHLPRSSLLALVGAFTGMEQMWRAYDLAITERYRFFSFGDAMLII